MRQPYGESTHLYGLSVEAVKAAATELAKLQKEDQEARIAAFARYIESASDAVSALPVKAAYRLWCDAWKQAHPIQTPAVLIKYNEAANKAAR